MKIKDIVMQLFTCGYVVLGEDQIHAFLNGVDKDYDLVYATIASKIDAITIREVRSMLLTQDKCLEKHNNDAIDGFFLITNMVQNQAKQFNNEGSSDRSFANQFGFNNPSYESRGQDTYQKDEVHAILMEIDININCVEKLNIW